MFGIIFMIIWLTIVGTVVVKVFKGTPTRFVNGQLVSAGTADFDFENFLLNEVIDNTLKKYQKENLDKQYTPKMTRKVILMYTISALITIIYAYTIIIFGLQL